MSGRRTSWEFQAKSGSSGSCRLFLRFLGKIAVQEMSGKTPGSSSRHPRLSDRSSRVGTPLGAPGGKGTPTGL